MSNFWLNVRIGIYHLQGEKGKLFWLLKISKNEIHKGNPKKFEVYDFKWFW